MFFKYNNTTTKEVDFMAKPMMNIGRPFIIQANKVELFKKTNNKKDIESIIAIASRFEQNNEKLKNRK